MLGNFTYCNPTKLYFGKDALDGLNTELPKYGKNVLLVYGGIMNPAAALMYNGTVINRQVILAYYVSGLPMDLVHAAATVIFLLLAAEPMLEKLDRIKVKYGLVE